MADVHRIVRLPDNGRKRTQVLLDLADLVAYVPMRGSWQYTAPAKKAALADAGRRYGGGREVANAHDNAQLTRTFTVKGASADTTLANLERLAQELEDFEGKFFEWRPDGASRSVYLELRGTATRNDKYANPQFGQNRSLEVDVGFPIAPLALADACDFVEDWSGTTPLGDYTDRSAVNAVQITGGQLAPNGSLSSRRLLGFTARGYKFRDMAQEAAFLVSALGGGFELGEHFGDTSTDHVRFGVGDNGTNSYVFVTSVAANATVQNSVVNAGTRFVVGQTVWVRARVEGYVCVAELFTTPPGPASTPATTATLTLASAGEKAIADSPRYGGILFLPIDAGMRCLSYAQRPYSYASRPLPEVEALRDVPGTAPPLFEAHLTPTGGAAAPIFSLLGWWRRPATFNWLWNGDFADNANGWSVAAVTGFNGAATSITRTAGTPSSPAKYGTYYGRIVTPATANAGANFKLYRRFRKGVTYTFDLWVRTSAGQSAQVQLGNEAGTDVATGSSTVLSTTGYTLVTVAWTPTAHTDVAYAAVRQVNATAVSLDIDGGDVYEGTVAPVTNQHAEGKGAVPPVGIIDAVSHDQANLSGWSLSADANYRTGYGLKVTTSGAGTAAATYLVDAALCQDDDFSDGTLHVEVWAVVELASGLVSPHLNVSALPESGIAAERLSDWGSIGKALVKPSSGSAKRPVRIGVLRLPTVDGARWRLKLSGSWGASSSGVFGVDYMWAVPARGRASSPSAKANDASYPDFVPSTAEITRRILPNLSGQTIKEPGYPTADTGLGGAPLELPSALPGATARDVDVLVKLSSLVPDDPTLDTTTEQLSHTATLHFGVTPRYFLARPS